jgi:hypothetical protein
LALAKSHSILFSKLDLAGSGISHLSCRQFSKLAPRTKAGGCDPSIRSGPLTSGPASIFAAQDPFARCDDDVVLDFLETGGMPVTAQLTATAVQCE